MQQKQKVNKINLIQSNVKSTWRRCTSLRECDFQNSVATVVARRVVHKYVDGYYSRLAALRKRSENFRGVDINTIVIRLRPSETKQCNTFESGTNL